MNISLIPHRVAVKDTLQVNDNHTENIIEFLVTFAIQCSLNFLYSMCNNEHLGPFKNFLSNSFTHTKPCP